ncbi:TetR/AcrR family transcriptional regulator [Streptomyces brasiliensis]|uniref:TetR family transcriptional regulator n=1 Tax=Streptomyces brasiliensis TaxID=1954 RepID=A0A917KY33_9ACTN|nr:TetR/AcrR family transcriptional regulator [Streptomyces brasiliensis]GGJ35659.1 TetR family transcriptional regulator [Streptomyces brasiliensis]
MPSSESSSGRSGLGQVDRPRRGRPRRGPDPERLQEIIDAAATVFLEKGYDGTSTKDISDAVGMLKGSLYYYVRSKEDFLFEIIKRVYDAALVSIQPAVELEGDALTRLRAFVHAHVGFAVKNLTAFTIQLREFERLSPERRLEITAGGDAYLRALRGILKDGQREGVFDEKIDVSFTALAILGQLNSLTQWYRPNGRLSVKRLAENFAGLVITSIASDSAVQSAGGPSKLRRSR